MTHQELRALDAWIAAVAPFNPTTDPVASDALLDKMAELGWQYSIALGGSGNVWVLFHRHDGENMPYMPYGTATDGNRHMAIALAAKAALESEAHFGSMTPNEIDPIPGAPESK